MQTVNFGGCRSITGTADLGGSEVHIYLIRLAASLTRSSFLTIPSSPFHLSSFLLPRRAILLAGDLTQWHLPVGMKDLNLRLTRVTGKATSQRLSEGHFTDFLIWFKAANRTRILIPHFIHSLSFRRRGRQDRAPRGHAERELRVLHVAHRYG
jgi:hypothetical protein